MSMKGSNKGVATLTCIVWDELLEGASWRSFGLCECSLQQQQQQLSTGMRGGPGRRALRSAGAGGSGAVVVRCK